MSVKNATRASMRWKSRWRLKIRKIFLSQTSENGEKREETGEKSNNVCASSTSTRAFPCAVDEFSFLHTIWDRFAFMEHAKSSDSRRFSLAGHVAFHILSPISVSSRMVYSLENFPVRMELENQGFDCGACGILNRATSKHMAFPESEDGKRAWEQ